MALDNFISSSSLRQKLENAGYETIQELKETNLIQLSKGFFLYKVFVKMKLIVCKSRFTINKRRSSNNYHDYQQR